MIKPSCLELLLCVIQADFSLSVICFSVSGIHAVHDVTVAYPYNIPIGELQLLNGEFPREVHFHIKRYSIEEVKDYNVLLRS